MASSSSDLARIATGTMLWLGAFAGWTLGSVPLTLTGAPFSALWLAAGTAILGIVAVWRSRGALVGLVACMNEARPALPDDRQGLRKALAICGLLGAVIGTQIFLSTGNAIPLWALFGSLAAIGLLLARPAVPVEGHSEPIPEVFLGLAVLSLVIVALYVGLHRPDADDAFYLNLPIGLKTDATGMMARDSMYLTEGWPILGTNYRAEALPTLVAALSAASGLSVLVIAHAVLPLVWCVVYAATLQIIGMVYFGRRWWLFAAIALALGLTFGGTYETWGVHGITRLFHGKGPLLLIVFPLIVHVVLQHRRGAVSGGTALWLLAALETAALGLTANSVYLAPLALGLPLAAGVLADGRAGVARLSLLLAAVPPLLVGLWLVLFDRPVPSLDQGWQANWSLSLFNLAQTPYLFWVLFGFVTLAALAGSQRRGGAWASAYLLAITVFIANPVLLPYYSDFVTGGLNFRLYWAVPFPILAAALLLFMLPERVGPAHVTVLLGAVALVVLGPASVMRMPGTWIAPSLLKVPEAEWSIAAEAGRLTPAGYRVLAPEEIAVWISAHEGHPAPVYLRTLYLDQNSLADGVTTLDARRRLAAWINGDRAMEADDVQDDLRALCIGLVVLSPETKEDLSPAFEAYQVLRHTLAEGYDAHVVDIGCTESAAQMMKLASFTKRPASVDDCLPTDTATCSPRMKAPAPISGHDVDHSREPALPWQTDLRPSPKPPLKVIPSHTVTRLV